jgi:hypothetical protein
MKRTLFATVTMLALSPAAFAQTPAAATQTSAMPTSAVPGAVSVAPTTRTAAVVAHTAMFTSIPTGDDLSSNVVGLDIYNASQQKIGTVKDIAMSGGRVNAYIVGVGGFLGIGDHYVAVTPSSIELTYGATDKKWHATMDTDAAALKAAPEYKYAT